jgi:two-component system sensor histidine kinase HydH
MKTVRNKSTRVLLFSSAFVLLVAVSLLWVVTIRETERRDLLLEYEAFRASSAVVDEYRKDQSFIPDDDKRIIGFGFYMLDGGSFMRYGSAPEAIPMQDLLFARNQESRATGLPGSVSVAFADNKKSIRLIRYSGLQNPARMMNSTGAPLGQGMGMGRGRQITPLGQTPELATSGELSLLGGTYFIWMEYSADGMDGEKLQFFLVAALISVALLGLFILLVFVFRHNEDLLTRETEMRELVQLGEAARTLVHEIKNPLGIMRIQTARIRRAAPLAGEGEDGGGSAARRSSQLAESADIIEGEIMRLSGLADRIREFLKPGPARRDPVDLQTFLSSYCNRYKDLGDSGIELIQDFAVTGSAYVSADAEKLGIALDNLIRNSIEAVEDLPAGKRRIAVRLFRREGSWIIAIIDSGKGIPAEILQRIFDPFFTTKEKGSGIGLALARRLVESFGGSLAYEGANGEGAVFSIRLKEEKAPTA